MAEFIPSLNSRTLDRMTSGERRVAHCLQSLLEDDYLIWYDIPIGKKRRYPDFIILHPAHGLLFLEVKDWKLENLEFVTPTNVELRTDNGLVTRTHPLAQVRQCAYAILDILTRDGALRATTTAHQGNLIIPYGWGVVFTKISRQEIRQRIPDEKREMLIPDHLALYKDDISDSVDAETLQSKLWGMFTYQFGNTLTLSQIDRIRWHLFPEIRIDHAVQTSLFPEADEPGQSIDETLPNNVKVMDIQQEQLARSLGEGHRVIHGVSGSGKTLILRYRCLELAHVIKKPILVMCFNITLAAKLRAFISTKGVGHQVKIYHFHDWCHQQLKTYDVDLVDSDKPVYERWVESVIHGVEKGSIPKGQYGAVLIDEGHDFNADWLKLVVQMVDPEINALLLLYDDVQSIYKTSKTLRFTLASVGIQAQGRTTILWLNYRNTREIMQFAYAFVRPYLTTKKTKDDEIPLVEPTAAGNKGAPPIVRRFDTFEEEVVFAAECITTWCQQGVSLKNMAVLYTQKWQGGVMADRLEATGIPYAWLDTQQSKRTYHPDDEKVTVLTIHSSKGLEFLHVIILGIGHLHDDEKNLSPNARLLYVGMTRAQESLFMTASHDNQFSRKLIASTPKEAAYFG